VLKKPRGDDRGFGAADFDAKLQGTEDVQGYFN